MTREEFLEKMAISGDCDFIPNCNECPYYNIKTYKCSLNDFRIKSILAKVLLRTFPKQKTNLEELKKENEQLKELIAKIKEAWIDYQMVKDDDPNFHEYVNYIILGKWKFER